MAYGIWSNVSACLYVCHYYSIVTLLFCLLVRFNFNTSVFDVSDLTTFYLPDSEAFEVHKHRFVKAWMVLHVCECAGYENV